MPSSWPIPTCGQPEPNNAPASPPHSHSAADRGREAPDRDEHGRVRESLVAVRAHPRPILASLTRIPVSVFVSCVSSRER